MFRKISLALLVCLISFNAIAQKKYRIMGDPAVGSKFRPVEVESFIPFNKRYQQLSNEQKDLFRANYGVLKESEHPPFPKKGMRSIYKPIIKGHAKVSQGGTLFAVAMVDENGIVENVAVYESPAPAITELAQAVLLSTEFDPALCDGNPCKMEFPFEFKMRNRQKAVVR